MPNNWKEELESQFADLTEGKEVTQFVAFVIFIETEIIEKLLDEIPDRNYVWNAIGEKITTSDLSELKQQLQAKWLGGPDNV